MIFTFIDSRTENRQQPTAAEAQKRSEKGSSAAYSVGVMMMHYHDGEGEWWYIWCDLGLLGLIVLLAKRSMICVRMVYRIWYTTFNLRQVGLASLASAATYYYHITSFGSLIDCLALYGDYTKVCFALWWCLLTCFTYKLQAWTVLSQRKTGGTKLNNRMCIILILMNMQHLFRILLSIIK